MSKVLNFVNNNKNIDYLVVNIKDNVIYLHYHIKQGKQYLLCKINVNNTNINKNGIIYRKNVINGTFKVEKVQLIT